MRKIIFFVYILAFDNFAVFVFLHRSHLREIKDRSVLRLFESTEVVAPAMLPGGPGVPQPLPPTGGHWDQDPVSSKFVYEYFFYLILNYSINYLLPELFQ